MPTVPDDRKPYPDPERPGVFRVPLTQGLFALIDAADVDRVGRHVWCAATHGTHDGKMRAERQEVKAGRRYGRTVLLNRFVMSVSAGQEMIFRNGDPLDSRRQNLLVGDRSDVCFHRRKLPNTTSRFKGVSRHKEGKWVAAICPRGRWTYLGLYANEEQAARVYDEAARKHFGEFARPNFPD